MSIPLRQADFEHGSVILRTPGAYHLEEDIVFHPNPDNDFMPTAAQLANGDYNGQAFQLGFFGAIIVVSNNVHIDGKGFEIRQSPAHNLHQTFYAHIEYGNAAFIDNEGPVDFVEDEFVKCAYQSVCDMRFGLSSHHGIHGNFVQHLKLENLEFENFEVSAYSFNVLTDYTIRKITVGPINQKVPVKAIFSAARFARFAIDMIVEHALSPTGVELAGEALRTELQTRIDAVEDEVLDTGSTSDCLFRNPSGLVDGNFYGFLIKGGAGPAVNDLAPDPATLPSTVKDAIEWSERGRLHDIEVRGIRGNVNQVVALSTATDTPQTSGRYAAGIQKDCFGAVLQIVLCTDPETGEYVPNVVSRTQAFVARYKEFLPPMLRDRVTISPAILAWMETPGSKLVDAMEAENLYYVYNGDGMHHVNKGGFGVRMDMVRRNVMSNVRVHVQNDGEHAGTVDGSTYEFSHEQQTQVGYQGSTARGYCFAACESIHCCNVTVDSVLSLHGDAVGVEMMGGTSEVGPIHVRDIRQVCAPEGTAYKTRGYKRSSHFPNSICSSAKSECCSSSEDEEEEDSCCYSSEECGESSSSFSECESNHDDVEECCLDTSSSSDSDSNSDSSCYHPAAVCRPHPNPGAKTSQCPVWCPPPQQHQKEQLAAHPTTAVECKPEVVVEAEPAAYQEECAAYEEEVVEQECVIPGGVVSRRCTTRTKKLKCNKSSPYSTKVRVFIIVLSILLFLALFALFRRWRARAASRYHEARLGNANMQQ